MNIYHCIITFIVVFGLCAVTAMFGFGMFFADTINDYIKMKTYEGKLRAEELRREMDNNV